MAGDIEQDQAAAFLTDHLGLGVTSLEPIGRGAWSRAFAFRHEGQELVVRFGQHGEDFEKDQFAARFAAPNLPIPRVLEIGEALGGWYALSERAYGRFIDDLSHDEMRATLQSVFTTLDAARMADLTSTTGYGGWGADGNAPGASWGDVLLEIGTDRPDARTAGWRQRLSDSATGIAPFDEAAARLADLVAYCPRDRHLIHSDLLHWNVLVEGQQITAVVDWGCSLYGDFLYDIAWFVFWGPWYPAWQGLDWVKEASAHFATIKLVVPDFDERLRACQIHIGLANLQYSAWTGNWEQVTEVAAQTLAIARG